MKYALFLESHAVGKKKRNMVLLYYTNNEWNVVGGKIMNGMLQAAMQFNKHTHEENEENK